MKRFGDGLMRRLVLSLAVLIGALGAVAGASAAGLGASGKPTGSSSATTRAHIGSSPRLPRGARITGALPGSKRLQLVIALKPQDPSGLQALAGAVATPGSSQFHHYLSVSEFARRFGAKPAQLAAVQSRLHAEGLTVGSPMANHLSLPVSGSATQVQAAFATKLSQVKLASGRVAYVNTVAPTLATSVASDVQSVVGLNNLAKAQPQGLERGAADPQRAASNVAAQPATSTTGSGPQPCQAADGAGGYTADTIASAYGFSSLYEAGDEGAGQTIGLFEAEPYNSADIAAYQSCYGAHATVTADSVDSPPNYTSGDDDTEAALDIEQVIGLAPKANLIVYDAPDTDVAAIDEYSAMVSQDVANVLSISWGFCESDVTSDLSTENTIFEEAAAQGQSVFAATGDTGSAGCQRNNGSTALSVEDPASEPFVTSVGGTTLYTTSGGQVSPWAPGDTEDQSVWNDGTVGGEPSGSTGGVSSDWPMPAYQSSAQASLGVINSDSSGTQCGQSTGDCREVPDVSADADPNTGYTVYVNGAWEPVGGTSAAAPLWAAFTALVNASSQCSGRPVGFLNPSIYQIAGSAYSANFTDIAAASPTTGDANDDATGTNSGMYPVTSGYDMTTGLGTPIAPALTSSLCGVYVTNPGSQSTPVGTTVSLPLSATDAGGTSLTYAASGLPAGVSINASTGVISGTATTIGASTATVTATDASGDTGSTVFRWAVYRKAVPGDVLVAASLQGEVLEAPAGGGPDFSVGTGLYSPWDVAVDSAGDVFIADTSMSSLVEVPAHGGAQTTVGTGLNKPEGVTVDSAGNVFVSEVGNGRAGHGEVVEMPAGGGPETVVASGLYNPQGLAVDSTGDVFIADQGANKVLEVPAGGGTSTTIGTQIASPYDVAVDSAGDVFIANSGYGDVEEIAAAGGAQRTVVGGLSYPTGVALDASGDVFIADSSADDVLEEPASGGSPSTVATNLNQPIGLAVYAPAPTFSADTPATSTQAGTAYSYTYTAGTTTGEPAATFALDSGSLPPGMTLSSAGVLAGTPTTTGTYTFAVKAEDVANATVGPSTTISVTPGQAASVKVALSPAAITANGLSTSTASATVTDAEGNPVSGDALTIASSGAQQVGTVTAGATPGTYKATVTSTTTAGQATITATDTSVSTDPEGTATLTQTAGPATAMTLGLSPQPITANGNSTSTATATVTDAYGNPVTGDMLTITSSGAQQVGTVTTGATPGTYQATIRSTTTAGQATITATDTSATAHPTASTTLRQAAGPATGVTVVLSPVSVTADGSSTLTATATVTDANGNPVSGDTVMITPSGGQLISAVTEGGTPGTYKATIRSTTTTGQATITATDTSAGARPAGVATLTQTPGPAAALSVALSPATITADGTSTSTATATVTDTNGNGVSGETVSFGSSGSQPIGLVTAGTAPGTYEATIVSTTAPGQATITATDAAAAGRLSGTAVLMQTTPLASSIPPTSNSPSSADPNSTRPSFTAPSSTPPVAAQPTTSQIKAAVSRSLAVSGSAATIKTILKHGYFSASLSAAGSGTEKIVWFIVIKGAHRSTAKHEILASGSAKVTAAGSMSLKVRLTKAGRTLLKRSKRVSLTAQGTFTPAGDKAVIVSRATTLK